MDWKFIDRDSPAVNALASQIPIDVALSAPEWAKNLACTYVLQRLNNEIRDNVVVEPEEDEVHLVSITHLSIAPEERLAARAWKQGGVTKADLAQVYGDSPAQLKKGLRAVSVKYEWQIQSERKNLPPVRFGRGML